MFPIPMVSGQPQLPATVLKDTEINKTKTNQPKKTNPKNKPPTTTKRTPKHLTSINLGVHIFHNPYFTQ